jgi:hypothetical protein
LEKFSNVIPAKAGIRIVEFTFWIPAFAGMTPICNNNRLIWDCCSKYNKNGRDFNTRQDLIPPQKVDGLEDAQAANYRHQLARVIIRLKGNFNWPLSISDMKTTPDQIDNQALLHLKDMEKQWTKSADFCNSFEKNIG